MTEQLPDPLVPAEVDLRGYEFMPYYGDRLRDSDLNSRATDAEYRAAHNLWWSAWKQVPAASVPDDDVVLARLADLGRDVKSWQKVRDVALRGFVKCSDGRFYHKVLSPLAIDAFEFRNTQRNRTEAARKAKALHKQLQEQSQSLSQSVSTITVTDAKEPENPSVTDSTGEERIGQDRTLKPTSKAVALVGRESAPAIAEALRHCGMKISELHPSVQQLAEQGVSKEIAVEAYRIAVQDRGKTSPAIGYLMPIINDLRNGTIGERPRPMSATMKAIMTLENMKTGTS